ncbi:MAG TPA: hypothetical protein VKM94_24375 [Blastocatellia bacterium]|nr:hypothetical protein [Blastocatellia bacterium]
MWQRTKRLINAYLDDLIQKVSGPDREVRQVTRDELTRLNEIEVQARASAKMFEKEQAELELKISGLLEREQLLHQRGDEAGAQAAARDAAALVAQHDLAKQQRAEANSAAERAKALREQRRVEGESLATETHLTAMREGLSSLDVPLSSTDPGATIDEMRARIGKSAMSDAQQKALQADRELEEARARASVEDMLARYKQGLSAVTPPAETPPLKTTASEAQNQTDKEEEQPAREKTLGKSSGPIKPID